MSLPAIPMSYPRGGPLLGVGYSMADLVKKGDKNLVTSKEAYKRKRERMERVQEKCAAPLMNARVY